MNKKQEAFLSLFYSIGSQPEASKSEDNEVYIKFTNAVNREAQKRDLEPLEYLTRLETNKKERLQLIDTLEKKHPKFSKIYEHAKITHLTGQIMQPGRLTKKGKTFLHNNALIEAEAWEVNNIEYLVRAEDIIKLQAPKVSVSQLKNLSLLMGMIQEQQFNNTEKEARCEFNLSYYAERRGYTKEEIRRGGMIFEELKRDILTGHYTHYRIKKIIGGKRYIAHNNFYNLVEPQDPGGKWTIEFNPPYNKQIIEILKGEARQYFIKESRAIEDRHTTQKPHLFYFYQQLIKRKRNTLVSVPAKVKSLLKDMNLQEKILIRPKECFKILHEGIVYWSENYQPQPEIESINLYNDYRQNGSTLKITLNISEDFKKATYSDFKDMLEEINVKDLRDAYISFKRPYKEAKKKTTLTDEETKLFNKTMRWINEWVTKIPLEDKESMIRMYIKKIGAERYEDIFNGEGNRTDASAVNFLTKALPEYLKDKDKRPPGYKKYRVLN